MKRKSIEFDEAIWSLGVLVLLGFWLFICSSPIRLDLLPFFILYTRFLRLYMAWLVMSWPTFFNIIS